MADHEHVARTGEAQLPVELQEELNPQERKIQATLDTMVSTARALADREAPGVKRHVIKHKDGTFSTEIYGLGMPPSDESADGTSRAAAGHWMAESVTVRYPSSEDGVPTGHDVDVNVDVFDSRSRAHVNQPGSVNDGKQYFKDRTSVSFSRHSGLPPHSYSSVIRNGNMAGERNAYDTRADVAGPVDAILADLVARGSRFVERTEVSDDLVAKVAAERAKAMLVEQEQARRAVAVATMPEMPRFAEPESWKAPARLGGDRVIPQGTYEPPVRDITGYRVDSYTSGRVVTPQRPSQSFLDAYPDYANKMDAKHTPVKASKTPVSHKIRSAGRRIKHAVTGKKPKK
jgi:hypothetical protein